MGGHLCYSREAMEAGGPGVPQYSTRKGNPMVKFPKQLFSHQPGTGWEHPLFSSEVVTQGTLETRSSTWSPDGVVLLS